MYDKVMEALMHAEIKSKANDNLYEQIQELSEEDATTNGIKLPAVMDKEYLQQRVEKACAILLNALLVDQLEDHNTKDTAKRMAKMFVCEAFKGRYEPMPCITEFPNAKNVDQIYTVGPITIRSACSHHFVPIMGQLWVGILPNKQGRLLGLSKFARLADWIFRRPQIQEEATQQYAELLEKILDPRAVGVVVRAEHLCTTWRGVQDPGSSMVTSVMLGHFRDEAMSRQEFFNLIKGQGF